MNAKGKKGKKAKQGEREPSSVDKLVRIGRNGTVLFHSPERIACVDVLVKGCCETWPVASEDFRDWLVMRFLNDTGRAPNTEALQAAVNTLSAVARCNGEQHTVYTRVAFVDAEGQQKIYLDVGDRKRHVIEVTAAGWRVMDHSPAKFCRSKTMRALPLPAGGGSIDALRRFVNVASDEDFVLLIVCLLYALRGRGPFTHLVLYGGDGCAKTTTARVLASFIDPIDEPSKPPHQEEDLVIAASKRHLTVYDNISKLPDWLSDALCRLSTGGSLTKRKQYSDGDEFVVAAKRPAILTGIQHFVTRADLERRCISLTLPQISEMTRQPEEAFWIEFEAKRAGIMGALLGALVEGLRRQTKRCPARLPRKPDFYLWGLACASAFRPAGMFARAYAANEEDGDSAQIEANPALGLVFEFISDRREWTGTGEQLRIELAACNEQGGLVDALKSAGALSRELDRGATILRKNGIAFERLKRTASRRLIRLARLGLRGPKGVPRNDVAERTAQIGSDSDDGQANATVIDMPLRQGNLLANDGCDGSSSNLGEKGKRKGREGEEMEGEGETVMTVMPSPMTPADGPAWLGLHEAALSVLPTDPKRALSRDQVATHPTILPLRFRQREIRDGLRELVRRGAAAKTANAVPRYWRS